MDLTAFYSQFRDETAENIRILNAGLLVLESLEPGAEEGREHIDTVFRAMHTIKGSARLLGFEGLGHRNVLFAPPVFRAVMHELAPKRDGAQPRRPAAGRHRAHDLRHSA